MHNLLLQSKGCWQYQFILIVEFANSIDPDEAAHNELSHLDLACYPS